ncbi:MAG: hypothetical protein MUP14_00675 [Dehalococcoidia bacterium]|nr:hypothetical protein [Dehalococcoidia bacterium]
MSLVGRSHEQGGAPTQRVPVTLVMLAVAILGLVVAACGGQKEEEAASPELGATEIAGTTAIATPEVTPSAGVSIVSRPSVVIARTTAYAFIEGTDGTVWYRQSDSGGPWSDWISLGGVIEPAPAAVVAGDDIYLFSRTAENDVRYNRLTGGTWSDWQGLGGVLRGSLTAVAGGGDDVYVFGTGTEGGIWYRHWDGVAWGDWTGLGAVN